MIINKIKFFGERWKEATMRKLAILTGAAALAAALLVGVATLPANAQGNQGFGFLEEPNGPASWLGDHYDNRSSDVTGGPAFDDSAEVKFVGTVVGLGKVTVEQSAAWTFTTFGAAGAGPCALVYDSSNPRTLVRIHKHQGVSTENVSGPLTLIPGSAVNDPGGPTEFPFSAAGVGANGLDVGTHTFTGTFTVTKKNGKTITGIVEGGTNCEVASFTTVGGHPPAGVFDFTHSDTNHTVQTVLEITGGTAGETGTGVLVFSYDSFDPHGLLHAHIVLDLD